MQHSSMGHSCGVEALIEIRSLGADAATAAGKAQTDIMQPLGNSSVFLCECACGVHARVNGFNGGWGGAGCIDDLWCNKKWYLRGEAAAKALKPAWILR